MTDARRPLWEKEESVEATAPPAFAFRYWTSVANMAADPGIERVETDGEYRDRLGMRGYLEGVEAGFATSLRDGMRAVRDRIDETARRAWV